MTKKVDLKTARLNRMVGEIEGYAILLLDAEGNIETWNKGAETVKGYQAEEVIGKNFRIFYTPEDLARDRPGELLQLATQNGSATDESWRVRKDGTRFWGNITITAIHDENGEVIGFAKVTRDLTALKLSQEELRTSEERYSRMVEEVQDYAILMLDKEGNIISWNQGAEKIKGYTAAEIIGKSFRLFYSEEDKRRRLPETFLAEAMQHGRAKHEGWRVRKNGSRFWGSVVITALHNEHGDVIGFSKVTKDLTEKKLIEEAQEKYMQELEARNKEMEQLAYIASHDLQEPLRTITSFISLFETKYSSLVDEAGKKQLRIILQASIRMRSLVKGLLEYAIIGMNTAIGTIDCGELLEEVKTDLTDSITASGATILNGPLPVIQGYRVELHQLFQNLISNAIKFCKPGIAPVIEIQAERRHSHWLFTVKDNGIGMDKRFIDKIFLMFQRLHSKEEYPGLGIGLAYAKKIVTLHGGNIWVESEPGAGSTFHFLIQGASAELAEEE